MLFMGDSYTSGEGVDPADSWPRILVERINRAAGAEVVDRPVVLAQNGWTTADLLAAFDANPPAGPFALATLCIGANNQFQGRSLGEYRMQFSALLERALSAVDHRALRTVVISIPDWGVSPYAEGRLRSEIAVQIDAFNAVSLEEAGRRGVLYAGITEISRKFAKKPETFANDALHPAREQYEAWVDKLFPLVKSLLSTTRFPASGT